MIRTLGVAAILAGVGLGLAFAPPASADLYDDFDVGVADRPFFDWLVADGNFVLFPASAKSQGSYKPLLRLGYDTCDLVNRVGVDSAFNYLVTNPMPGQKRPLTRKQADRWLYGAVPNLCPKSF